MRASGFPVAVVAVSLLVPACSPCQLMQRPTPTPTSTSAAQKGTLVDYSLWEPDGIGVGRVGALWFTELQGNKIGRITMSGDITKYALGLDHSGPQSIAAGPDGALWFTEMTGGRIGRITTSGRISEYVLPTIRS